MTISNISQQELDEITDILNVLLTRVAGKPVCYVLLVGPVVEDDGAIGNSSTSQMMSNTRHDILPSWLRDAANRVEETL